MKNIIEILLYCIQNDYLVQKSIDSQNVDALFVLVGHDDHSQQAIALKELKAVMLENGFRYGVWANQAETTFIINCKCGTSFPGLAKVGL